MADDSPQTPKEVNPEIAKSELQLAELDSQISKAKKALRLIDKYTDIFTKLELRATNSKSGFGALLKSAQDAKNKINENVGQAKQLVQDAQNELGNIKEKNSGLIVYLQEFESLKSQLNSPESGLKTTLDNVQELNTKLQSEVKDYQAKLSQIDQIATKASNNLVEINTAYKEFLDLKVKLEDPNVGLASILSTSTETQNQINAVKEQANKIFSEISRIKDDSNSFLNDIKNIKEQSEKLHGNILQFEKESQENKEKIEQIYKLATDTGLANSFDARKKELKLGVWVWQAILGLSVIIITVILIWLYSTSLKNNYDINILILYRFTLTFPFIFLIVFSANQYAKERGLLEKYAFKAANALALESYTRLLTTRFSKFEKEIVTFVLDCMKLIYKEPWENNKESRFKLSLGNKLGEATAEIKETIKENTENVKENISKGLEKVEEKIDEINPATEIVPTEPAKV